MKLINVLISIAVIGLAGCSKQGPDPRIAELERRLAKAEYNLRICETNDFALQNQIDIANRYMKDTADLMARTATLATNMQTGMSQLLALTNSPVVAVQRPARAVNPGPIKEGIPLAVYNQITAAAAKDHPNDYRTQAYVIDLQVEAYRKLHP